MNTSPLNDPPLAPRPVLPPHGARLALLTLTLGTFTVGAGEFGMMSVLPSFASAMHVSVARASAAITAYALGVVVGAPLLSVLGARMGRRGLLVLMFGLFIAGNAATVWLGSFQGVVAGRFLAGLPHGMIFGLSALVAASMAPPERRGRAVGKALSGIMLATVVAAPLATWVAQAWGWRVVYAAIGLGGLLCACAAHVTLPATAGNPRANPLAELGAFKRPQVLLTLLTGAVGFGGMFGIYTFLTTALENVTGLGVGATSLCQVLWGLGLVAGNGAAGPLIDRNLDQTVLLSLGAGAVLMLSLTLLLPHAVPTAVLCLLIPAAIIMLSPALQTRLMDVAGDAQTMAAAMNHAAFNAANALGSWLAALLVGAGFGLGSVGWSGALLSSGGLLIYLLALGLARRQGAPHGGRLD
ncbi:MFS transporter [Formicincola oecophyllae]|uniref:MFS transporter n=1 Tax=Formicincola oecophyllae TaxID=2558361 RepID=A0A4Y6U8S7_9PROT|nr:MFS transporter [Formicincola oecophyllae]QDH13863.1 MFS transporter [Formicincola oecophyllae]